MDSKRPPLNMPIAVAPRRLVRPLLTIALFAFAIYTLRQFLPLSNLHAPASDGVDSGGSSSSSSVLHDGGANNQALNLDLNADKPAPPAAAAAAAAAATPKPAARRVPLEAHLMSKCPDARDCLRDLVLPAMQRAGDKVAYVSSFVGRPADNDGVECKHGPAECLGNIMMLCAADAYPDPKTYLGFTMCLMRRYKDIPDRSLMQDCALEHAMDFRTLDDCASRDDGAYGMGMLRESVMRTKEVSARLSSDGPAGRLRETDVPTRPGSRRAARCG
jgi:hypothetical protein